MRIKLSLIYTTTAGVMLVAAMLACGPPTQPTPTETQPFIAIITPETVTPAASDTPESGATATPTETPAPGITPSPTVCTYDGTYVADVTIPDGTQMLPGQAFTKTWRVINDGCLAWPTGTLLVFLRGDQMGGPATTPAPAAAVGGTVDVSVNLIAPATPGTYRGYWKLRSPDGILFGPEVFVEIVVVAPTATFTAVPTVTATPTSLPTPTNTPVPVTHSTGPLNISQTGTADLDEGVIAPPRTESDIWFQVVNATEMYITPRNNALLAIWGPSVPTLTDCLNAPLSGADIPIGSLPVGTYVCYRTNLGRPGAFRVNALAGVLSIGYTTWEIP